MASISTLIASSKIWYIDSRDSHHMIGVRDNFLDLIERTLDIEVARGDDCILIEVGVGIVSFERESSHSFKVTWVLYVPRLKKNLISISSIEVKGFEFVLRDEQALVYPKGSSITSAKVIGVHHRKLYMFMF